MWHKIKTFITLLLVYAGIIAVVVGGIGGFIYQLTEYGKYVDFIIYNHWTTWLSLGGIVSVVIGNIAYSLE